MKNVFFTIIFLLTFSILFAQEQIIPKKLMFKDSTGKIFINKSLPLYLKISQDPSQNSEHKTLISKTTPQFTNPMYLAKEGKNIIYSPWAVDTITKKTVYPKQNIIFEVYADGRPPTTTIHNNVTAYEKKDSLFFGAGLKVWFKAKDGISGVQNIYLSVNNEDYQEYLYDTLTFEHGTYNTLQYYSTDLVGNVEKIQSVSFSIDTARPLTNIVVIGNHKDNIVSGNCKVSLKPKDAFSGTAKTYYYIDNQQKKIYTTPINVGNLREGRHVLKYFTEDNVQNVENEKSFVFFVDRTPPMIIDEVIGDFTYINGKSYTSGRSQIQLTAIDNRAGLKNIYYSLDGKEWLEYDKPFDLPTNQKNIKVYYYAEDNVGNKTDFDINRMTTNKFFMSELDLNEPTISNTFQGPTQNVFDTICISAKTKIIIKAIDNQSGVSNINYEVDDKTNQEFKDNFTIKEQGVHNVTAYAFDKVNNVGSMNFIVKVDTTGPEIFHHFSTSSIKSGNKYAYPVGTKIYIGATDNSTGIDKITYKLNGNSVVNYYSFINLSSKGDFELEITAYDKLGNKTVEKFSFQIK